MNFKKSFGYTLVEIIVVVGLISLIASLTVAKYKNSNFNNNVQSQINDIEIIGDRITNAYQNSGNIAGLSTTSAIANKLVPDELINGTNVNTRFGDSLTILGTTVATVPVSQAFRITLNNIDSQICSKLATSKIGNQADEILINGVSMKAIGSPLSPVDIQNITNACGNATSLAFTNRIYYNQSLNTLNTYNQNRPNQTDKHYIPTVAATTTNAVAVSCQGGSAWNGSYCGCPVNTSWNGFNCQSVNSPSNCQYGTGNQKDNTGLVNQCAALPTTKTTETYYDTSTPTPITANIAYYQAPTAANQAACTAIGGYWDTTRSFCGGIMPTKVVGVKNPQTPTLTPDNRYVPVNYGTNIQQTTQQVGCTNAQGHWDGQVCNVCPSSTDITTLSNSTGIVNPAYENNSARLVPTMMSQPTTNPKIVTEHSAASTWNVDRCQTPQPVW